MKELMKAAEGLSVTFHRAFDVCRNPQKAMEEITLQQLLDYYHNNDDVRFDYEPE